MTTRVQFVAMALAVALSVPVMAVGCGAGNDETGEEQSEAGVPANNGADAPSGDAVGDGITGPGDGAAADGGDDGAADGGDGGAVDGGDGGAADGGAADGAADGGNADAGWLSGCTLCHGGDNPANNPAPPRPFNASATAVGAHQMHLGPSAWHHEVQCSECHQVPTTLARDPSHPLHMNAVNDIVWGPLAKSGTYSPATATCAGTYCHGATLKPDRLVVSNRTPNWTIVDGTQDACGTACHTLPPAGGHPANSACASCHPTIATFTPGSPPVVTWKDPSRHIDGNVDLAGLTCTSCHGSAVTNTPMPPVGTHGETTTAEKAVGAHANHNSSSTWHRDGQCSDCHALPASMSHANGAPDFSWGAVSTTGGAAPTYTPATATCADVYCHGSRLLGPNAGGTVSRSPEWNVVNGSYDSCGNTCHTNPPGAPHPQRDDCQSCHLAVIATYDPATKVATWTDRKLHVNGQLDGVCAACHGTQPSQPNPPMGVSGETATNTMAVGKHVPHVTASASHVAFTCDRCHVVPKTGSDINSHTLEYVASASLDDVGHHGDVTFSGAPAASTVFDVTATDGGAPVTARGTCLGGCHSDGNGGMPLRTPYWAGGTWSAVTISPYNGTSGNCLTGPSCCNCHMAFNDNGYLQLSTGRHRDHAGEVPCTACHPSPSTVTHVNGSKDVFPVVVGVNESIDIYRSPGTAPAPNTTACGARVTCVGRCHGWYHLPKCW